MPTDAYTQDLFRFIQESPTPFHAVECMKQRLTDKGFTLLKETEPWSLKPGDKYIVIRNHSALIAFVMGSKHPTETGIRLIGAHTDSPCLRTKPNPELKSEGATQLGVEIYGGALLGTWFDRGLNLAGRLTCRVQSHSRPEHLKSILINFNRPVAVIPSLAIHFDREANTNKTINPQQHIQPLWHLPSSPDLPFSQALLEQAATEYPDLQILEILGSELSLSEAEPPFTFGAGNELLSVPRLDNLLSCHAGLSSLLEAGQPHTSMLVATDHEEVGSETTSGARGAFLDSVLARITGTTESLAITCARSFLISCDNAHALHPSYRDKYDPNHLPLLNRGPVLKINSAQRYASNAESGAVFRYLCTRAGVPCQEFVVRSDMGCGSTIGPSIASRTGIRTVDIGAPTLAMHAVREVTGNRDPNLLFNVLKEFLTTGALPLLSLT